MGFAIMPCSLYDFPAMETWLAEQAKRGKHFTGFSGENDAKFEKGAPRNEVFRLEPSNGKACPDWEREELFSAAGWEFVNSSWHDDVWVFRACRPNPLPIHTDPETQAVALQRLEKRLRRNILVWAVLLVLWVVLFGLLQHRDISWQELVLNPMPIFQTLYWLCYSGVFLGLAVTNLLPLRRLVRSLKAGVPMEHETPRRGHRRLWFFGLIVVAALYLLSAFCLRYNRWEGDAALTECAGSYIPLAELGVETERNDAEARLERSALGEKRSILDGPVTERMTKYGQTRSWPAGTQLYRLRLAFMAKPLLSELRETISMMANAQQLTNTELDEAWYASDGSGQALLAREGGAVIFMRVSVPAEDLRDRLAEFEAVLSGTA